MASHLMRLVAAAAVTASANLPVIARADFMPFLYLRVLALSVTTSVPMMVMAHLQYACQPVPCYTSLPTTSVTSIHHQSIALAS